MTHYWTFNKAPKGKASQVEKTYQRAVKQCSKVIRSYSRQFGGLSGYSAHTETYLGLTFNGSERVGQCETFAVREHYSQNEKNVPQFCKTAAYPYDTVVTACLIILKHYMGDLIQVTSDSKQDGWNDGLILVQNVLNLKSVQIPKTIHANVKAS